MRILVIGLGQMGGSLAAAAKKAGHFVIGYNRNIEGSIFAKKKGWIDKIVEDFDELEELDPEIIIIGAALKAYPSIFDRLESVVNDHWIITDMGSVKSYVMDEAKKRQRIKKVFIGGHPMAGSEKAGIENSKSDLFQKCRWFITEFPNEPDVVLELLQEKKRKLVDFIRSVGGIPFFVESEHHDFCVGKASHLPQMLSVLMAAAVEERTPELKPTGSKDNPEGDYLEMAAGGFRDMSRLAGSSFDIWEDIFFLNKENLLLELEEVTRKIDQARELLKNQDREGLKVLFEKGNKTRQRFIEKTAEINEKVK